MKMDRDCATLLSSSSRFLFIACCLFGLLVLPAMAADASIEAELGDTLNLHGVSYASEQVYLFLTGPGLPANGVMLSDTSQRADQGHFTIVDLDDNQEWSYKWNTARIENQIDPGTYLVYVSIDPVDKSSLGGTSTYKTLEVYLKESTTQRVSINAGTSYTLNPEEHVSYYEAPPVVLTSPTPVPTTLTTPPTPEPTTIPQTTKAPISSALAFIASLIGACIVLYQKDP